MLSQQKLLDTLAQLYPNPKSELNFTGPYQLLVCVVLSAQCTDKKVNQVTPSLFSKYNNFKDLSMARLATLEKIIRPINYYRTKARNLIATSKLIVQDFKSKLPLNHNELISLPGVGNKTANVVLGELGVTETFPVDTHVFRVSQRLGLAEANTPKRVEEQLKATFKAKDWRNLHHWLILHGRRVCKAQRPLCAECRLNLICPVGQKTLSKAAI